MNNASSSSSSSKIEIDEVFVDESYFSALFDYEELFPISDENYSLELYLQEALFSSLIKKVKEPLTKTEPAESSRRFCIICMEEKSLSNIFQGTNCTHSYCKDCTTLYIATKIKENEARIKCPDVDCTHHLEPYTCQDLIPKEVFERWEQALCESLILTWDKFYCPFKDCQAMMVDDGHGHGHGHDGHGDVTQVECPSCHRLFCVKCKVTWHVGIGCEEFRRFGNIRSDKEDDLLIEMAKSKEWKRCPKCKYYVEKIDGCLHISCRCGNHFCYGCGSTWHSSHSCLRI